MNKSAVVTFSLSPERPNVLIFLIDSQGVDNLSCYGYYRRTSPNIDRIAKDGVVFLNNFSPCVWTPPAHASLFTGRYLSGHQLLTLGGTNSILSEEIPTIAEALNAIGYKTAAFSVNPLIANLLRHKHVEIIKYPTSYPLIIKRGKTLAKELFEEVGEPEGIDKGSLYTVHRVIDWIEKNYDGKTPFYVFVNVVEPHHPYWAGEPFRSRFLPPGVTEERAKKTPQMSGEGLWRKEYPWFGPFAARSGIAPDGEFGYPRSPEDWLIIKALLDGETAQVDHRIGLLINYLREKGIYDDTLIIITSDHHDILWEHKGETLPNGRIIPTGHMDVYDPNIHVPLIVKGYPEHFPPGTRVKNMTSLVDIFPTLIEILQIEDKRVKKSVQGYSLLLALQDDPPRKFIIAEGWWPLTGFYYKSWFKAYRDLKYKYIWRGPTGEEELYDIVNDPYEQENIISKMPEKGMELKKKLEKFLLSIEIPPIRLKRAALNYLIAWGWHRKIIPED
ncbi:hypothetical protein DRO64_08185 [Candidatus Bathyarchaeota archaeon]|nr:MAG: hypothetical protein DRO64_08185 [Candidatus Bathyarchaeota archaeon]